MAHRDIRNNPLGRYLEQIDRPMVEGPQVIRDNINNVLHPLVQTSSDSFLLNNGVSLSQWIQGRAVMTTASPNTASASNDESVVIDVEDVRGTGFISNGQQIQHPHSTSPMLYSAQSENSPPQDESNTHGQSNDILNFSVTPEATVALEVVKTYFPFITIIVAKSIFDYSTGILLFAGLFGTFTYYNSRLKREIALHSQCNVGFLLFSVVQLALTICFFYYLYYDLKLYLSLVFIPPYTQPPTAADLLWMVGSNDFIFRLMTIIVKVFVTLIPHQMLHAKQRGKWYVAIEATSQLYRSLLPIQLWLYYLLDSYQGPRKVVGVFLSAAYMVAKGRSLMKKAHTWWSSIIKLIKTVQFAVNPTKDQLSQAGQICPICHESYDTPVLLSCHHIFCEGCVARWLNYEQTCPMCRAKVFDDPSWRDGSTTNFIELF